MSYRVETSRIVAPDLFHQDGPTCDHLSAACELMEALMGDHRLAGIRIRDLSRNVSTQDPIIVAVYNLQHRNRRSRIGD